MKKKNVCFIAETQMSNTRDYNASTWTRGWEEGTQEFSEVCMCKNFQRHGLYKVKSKDSQTR